MATELKTVPVASSESEFVKGLGLTSATMLVMGSMIGSGIFIVSADIARKVDSPALLLGAWLVTGFLTITGALAYGELAAMMPHAGGQYVYLREAFGPMWGFLYGWSLFLVVQAGTIAAVGIAFGKFLGIFFHSVSSTIWLSPVAHVPPIPFRLYPLWKNPQNKSQNRGKFSSFQNVVSKHHDKYQLHHNSTIKKPRLSTTFSHNPLQKQRNTSQIKNFYMPPAHNPQIIFQPVSPFLLVLRFIR